MNYPVATAPGGYHTDPYGKPIMHQPTMHQPPAFSVAQPG